MGPPVKPEGDEVGRKTVRGVSLLMRFSRANRMYHLLRIHLDSPRYSGASRIVARTTVGLILRSVDCSRSRSLSLVPLIGLPRRRSNAHRYDSGQ